ncbi:MAG TPA: phosphoadenylyl-sulfate reductase [Myxococcota bacterium]|nr:phosphoadenylyl-sulfate reductase [Myxococcota bacterium]
MSPPSSRFALQPAPGDLLRDIESGVFEALSTHELLVWALKTFHPRIALSCSFGAPEGMALFDMLSRIEPEFRVFTLDTGRLPQATYDLMDRIRDRYDKQIEVLFPDAKAVEAMVREHGMNLFYESIEKRQLCCRLRKVDPLNGYLAGLDAWISGLRRDQGVTRTAIQKVEIDATHAGIVKVNPLADWKADDVWQYIRTNNVPVNRLHAVGYPSVGCDPCSRAIQAGEDPRAGRWWWENPETKECGIHVGEEKEGSGI